MSTWLQIRNWDKWQTYRKDRQQPPWIKLHRDLMRNADWISLSDAQRGQLVAIWMLAADRNGRIPDDAKLIKTMCFLDKPPDLDLLISHGFLDARVTPERRQRDAPEEKRIEIEESVVVTTATKRGSQVPEGWSPSLKTLSSLKTEKGFQEGEIHHELEKFRDFHQAKGTLFKDFEAAFRTWMTNSREFAQARGSPRLKALNGGRATSQPSFREPPPKIDNETWRKQREK